MCEYQGENDPKWTSHAEWDVKEYKKALGKITRVTFTSFDKPMQPFELVDNPAPDVSPLDLLVVLVACPCVSGKLCA
jgi:hypothetical protein